MMQSEIARLAPGLRRLTAPNPSPMTFTGTQTYIIGEGEVAVIDPGPDLEHHASALLQALEPGERVVKILVTHSHLDHSGLARRLARATSAPVLAAGRSDWGRSDGMRRLSSWLGSQGGEGVDEAFEPDLLVRQGAFVTGSWGEIEVLETPGHMANHLSFCWNSSVFTGDVVMGWSSSLISPPDGDMAQYRASLTSLASRPEAVFYPGHGDPIEEPRKRCEALLEHRNARETRIREVMAAQNAASLEAITRGVYTDIDPRLLPAAQQNTLAQLIDLWERRAVHVEGNSARSARFRLIG